MTIERPAGDVFAYIADYRHVPEVLEGIKSWKPIGRKTKGVGARYRVEVGVLGLDLHSELEITRWEPPGEIAWTTQHSPVPVRGRWRLHPQGKATLVELQVGYEPPGGGLGDLVASGIERILRSRLVEALERMKEALE